MSLQEMVVFLGLGSNTGNREHNLQQALTGLAGTITNIKVSSLYESLPRYRTDQPRFLNCVATGGTAMTPRRLLSEVHKLETAAGRDRKTSGWMGPRPLDIDILLHGALVHQDEELTIPHPAMKERKFVLVPLLELSPALRDPVDSVPYADHLSKLAPQGIYYYSLKDFDFSYGE